jgi:hypothetical protein
MSNNEIEFQPNKPKKSLSKLIKGIAAMTTALAITSSVTQADPTHPHPAEPNFKPFDCPIPSPNPE